MESLKGIDLAVENGQIFGFVGPNGAGKSTTIKILTGLLKPTGGAAWLNDKPVRDPASRKSVGYLPENPNFYGYLSLFDLLSLVARIRGMDKQAGKARIDELITLVGLQDTGKRHVKTFSKGMVQRAGIAIALLGDPRLIILDEPMSGLDPLGRDLVAKIFRNLQDAGKTIFFSTHIIPDIEALCDSVGILVEGELRYVGSVQDMLYSRGEKLEMTFSLPGIKLDAIPFQGRPHLMWQKEKIYKLEVEEKGISEDIRLIVASGGNIIKIEQRRKSFEALFKELTSSGPN
ncbi:MAG: ABC transporter ATP-binding protein [Desulfatiglandaceae bacterium]